MIEGPKGGVKSDQDLLMFIAEAHYNVGAFESALDICALGLHLGFDGSSLLILMAKSAHRHGKANLAKAALDRLLKIGDLEYFNDPILSELGRQLAYAESQALEF